MSGWEQVAGSGENDPVKLAETGEKQRWSFHGHVFDFECKAAPRKYTLIPNGVQLEMTIAETGGGEAPWGRIECTEVAIQAGDGAELLSDFDEYARINAQAKMRDVFAFAGKSVLAQEELAPPAEADETAEA
jgi:hypothetical protein